MEAALNTLGMSCRKLWGQMSPEQRLKAAEHFWARTSEVNHALRSGTITAIARARGSREISVRGASQRQLSKWTSGTQHIPEDVADSLMRLYLIHEQRQMVVAFLVDLEIPHSGAVIFEEFDPSTLSAQQLTLAALRLTEHFGAPATELYFKYTAVQSGAWGEVGKTILRSITTESSSSYPNDPINVEHVATEDDWLTNLDELLNRAVTATVAGSPGALDSAQLTDVIEEVLQNNPHRAKTYYHKGYLDVCLDHPVQPHFREENQDRRLWYLAGAIRALEDRGNRKTILDLFANADVKDLGREQRHRSALAAGPIFRALCAEGRVAAAVDFLAPQAVFYVGLFEWALEFGTRLLRAQEIESALRLFQLLDSAVQQLHPEQCASLGKQYFDLKRRQAHCLRFQRHFGDATKILRDLLKDPSAPEQSAMTVDIALMGAGFRGLLDVVVPGKDITQFINRLEQIRPALEIASSLGGDTAHATYCLGVLAIAKQLEPGKAAEWLEQSVTSILRHSPEYDLEGLLSRSRFYMGLAKAEALDASLVEKAGALFHDAIHSGFVPPDHLLARYIVGLSVVSADQAKRAAETALSKLGASRVLDSILDTEVASQSEQILSRLLECALDDKRSGKKRFHDLQRILKHAISGNYNKIAADALDGMEQLAREGVCTDEFLTLLEDDVHYHPAWTKSDAASSAVWLYERNGRLVEAKLILEREFHHTLSDKQHGFLEQADDILAKSRELGADETEMSALETRLVNARRQSAVTLISEDLNAIPVWITVVGGDERQAEYDSAIIDHISAQLGAVKIQFRHTGWSGRWGPAFDEMRPTLDRSDAVDLLNRLLAPVQPLIEKEYRDAAGVPRSQTQVPSDSVQTPQLNPAQLLIEQFKATKKPQSKATGTILLNRTARAAPAPASQATQRTVGMSSRLHVELEPWCEVVIDAQRVKSLTSEEVERLGEALKSRLHDETAR